MLEGPAIGGVAERDVVEGQVAAQPLGDVVAPLLEDLVGAEHVADAVEPGHRPGEAGGLAGDLAQRPVQAVAVRDEHHEVTGR